MKKILILSIGIVTLLFAACQKDAIKKVSNTTDAEQTKSANLKVNVVNPGSSTVVFIENGRYVAHFSFGDVDFGNVYYQTGAYLDGQAVLAVDAHSAGGPYVTAPYSILIGTASTFYSNDVQNFNTTWNKFFGGIIDPATDAPYTRPKLSDFISNSYGSVGIFNGILVRSHSVASTVIVRDASFVPVPPSVPNGPVSAIGGVTDPTTGTYWFMWGHDGIISKVTKNGSLSDFPFSFNGTYTGTPTNYHVIGTIRPTSTTSFNFSTDVTPL